MSIFTFELLKRRALTEMADYAEKNRIYYAKCAEKREQGRARRKIRDSKQLVKLLKRRLKIRTNFDALTYGYIHDEETFYYKVKNIWFYCENGNLMACIWRTGKYAGGSDSVHVYRHRDLAPYLVDDYEPQPFNTDNGY